MNRFIILLALCGFSLMALILTIENPPLPRAQITLRIHPLSGSAATNGYR